MLLNYVFKTGDRTSRGPRPRRRGLSILEVLISIGLLVVGMFGLFAILPLAGIRAQQALTADNTSMHGQNAFNAFEIRGMGDLRNWIVVDGQPLRLGNSYCIDPRYIAHPGGRSMPIFPYYAGPPAIATPMRRITLRAQPGGGRMNRILADRVFFDTATELSWFATLVPKYGTPPGTPLNPPLTNFRPDIYTLSVVVVHKRDPRFRPNATRERISRVTQFYSGGISGGDVRLQSLNGRASDVNVREGDRVMLSRNSPSGPIYKWYRVTRVNTQTTPNTQREVTLQGPDWVPDTTGSFPTQVTYVTGTVAVYEKTVRLESTSLWTPR